MDSNKTPPAFDIAKVEEKMKNIRTLSDLTGKNRIIQEIILARDFPIKKLKPLLVRLRSTSLVLIACVEGFRSKRDWPMILGQLKIVFGDCIQECGN